MGTQGDNVTLFTGGLPYLERLVGLNTFKFKILLGVSDFLEHKKEANSGKATCQPRPLWCKECKNLETEP